MDYEKKYKEALEIAQKLYQDCPNGKNDRLYHTTDLEKMFPELRESEDEKIRKELIEHVKDQQSSFISAPDCRDKYEEEENNKYNSWIAWLEKQDKQDVRYKHLKELLAADDIYQMSMNQDMVEEAKTKAINALSKLCISELLLEKQDKQKHAWGEEDETGWTNTMIIIKEVASNHYTKDSVKLVINWLKSLKEKYTWKPSDEQIIALRWVLNNVPYNKHKEEISGLFDQIKNL